MQQGWPPGEWTEVELAGTYIDELYDWAYNDSEWNLESFAGPLSCSDVKTATLEGLEADTIYIGSNPVLDGEHWDEAPEAHRILLDTMERSHVTQPRDKAKVFRTLVHEAVHHSRGGGHDGNWQFYLYECHDEIPRSLGDDGTGGGGGSGGEPIRINVDIGGVTCDMVYNVGDTTCMPDVSFEMSEPGLVEVDYRNCPDPTHDHSSTEWVWAVPDSDGRFTMSGHCFTTGSGWECKD